MRDDRPPAWARWPTEARADYLAVTHERAELVEGVVERVGLDVDPERLTPQFRFSKFEVAMIYLALDRR
jgi:hypothetical protein